MQRAEFSKREFFIITGAVIVSAAVLMIIYIVKAPGSTAVITADGKEIYRTELSGSSREFELAAADGAVFEINDGSIRIKSNDCPDKICVHTGFISEEGETIVCMPKKLIVTIEK